MEEKVIYWIYLSPLPNDPLGQLQFSNPCFALDTYRSLSRKYPDSTIKIIKITPSKIEEEIFESNLARLSFSQ